MFFVKEPEQPDEPSVRRFLRLRSSVKLPQSEVGAPLGEPLVDRLAVNRFWQILLCRLALAHDGTMASAVRSSASRTTVRSKWA